MELYQLSYFVETVRADGVNAAARRLNVSPPAISKAVRNLERELGCALFERSRQRLKLTESGEHLLRRAQDLLTLESRVREELGAGEANPELVLAGRELLLAEFGDTFVKRHREKYPSARIVLRSGSGEDALREVEEERAHIALSLQPPPATWLSQRIGRLESVTCVGPRHALYAKRGKIHIREVLEHGFISPNLPLFGRVASGRSVDGWRDDVHPRRIDFVVEDLSLIRKLLESGQGLAYIPRVWATRLDVRILTIEGCRFHNNFEVYASAKRGKELGWLGRLFSEKKETPSRKA